MSAEEIAFQPADKFAVQTIRYFVYRIIIITKKKFFEIISQARAFDNWQTACELIRRITANNPGGESICMWCEKPITDLHQHFCSDDCITQFYAQKFSSLAERGFQQLKKSYKKPLKSHKIYKKMKTVTENFYVDHTCFTTYNPKSSLKSWGMWLATRERCCCKTPSALKRKCRKFHFHGNLHVYPFVSGEFKPVERYTKRDEPVGNGGGSGRVEAGMGHKGL